MNYGTINHGDVTITLTQQAWLQSEGRYHAHGVGSDGLDYVVIWDTTQAWDDATAEARATGDAHDYPALLDDESNACDWLSPAEIRLA